MKLVIRHSVFLRCLFTQSFHLTCGLSRFLQPPRFSVSTLFGNLSIHSERVSSPTQFPQNVYMYLSVDDEDVHQCGRCKLVFRSIDEYFVHKKNRACQKVGDSKEEKCCEEKQSSTVKSTTDVVPSVREELPPPSERRCGRPRKYSPGVIKYAVNKTTATASVTSKHRDNQHALGSAAVTRHDDDAPLVCRFRSKRRRSTPKKLWVENGDAEAEAEATKVASDASSEGVAKEDDDPPHSKRTRRGRRKKPGRPQKKKRSGGSKLHDFVCPKCERTEQSKEEYDRHLRREHNISSYVCGACLLPFRDKYKLKRHVGQCTVEPDGQKLSDGHSIFAKLGGLDDAEENCDKGRPSEQHYEDNSSVAEIPTAFKCNECDYDGPTYDAIMKHLSRHPGKHPGICRFCGKWFTTRYKLWRHMMSSVHDMVSEEAMQQAKAELKSVRIVWRVTENRKRGNVSKVTCHECNIIFKSKRLIESHMKNQHAPQTMCKYRCGMCMRGFIRRRFLTEHLRTMHRVNRLNCASHFRCPVCSRVFSQNGHMYRHHEKMHTPVQQRPFREAGKAIIDVHTPETESKTLQSSSTTDQHKEASSEMADSKRMDGPSRFARKDGVIVAFGEKWVEVEPTTWNEQGADLRCRDAHVCFVCCKHLDTRQNFLQHVEHHLSWVSLHGGPQSANLFETTIPIDPSTCVDALAARHDDKDVVTCEANLPLGGPEDGSNDFENPLEAVKSPVLIGGMHEPGLRLTTINRNALIDMMQGHSEDDDTHGLSAPTTPPSVEASEQTEKQKTLEAAAAIVDLSEQAALLGNMCGSIVTARVVDDPGIAHLSETKSGTVDLERGLDVEVNYQCPYCGESAETLDAMYSHKTTDHNIQAVFRCVQSSCDKTFDDVDSYHQHSRVHSQLAFICLICNAHFSDSCELLAHKNTAHRRMNDSQRHRMCSTCHNMFVGKKTANTTADTTQCDYCATCSNTLGATADVSSREQKPKEFLCDQCGTTCGSRDVLTRHMCTHRASRDYRCALCEATFNKGEHLRRHIITKHCDERPFSCKFPGCTKSFKRRDKLQEHHRAHSEVRPYVCHICSRAYRYREGLRYHEKTHRRVSKYRCNACSQAFAWPGLLQEHMRNFHSESTKALCVYACDVCNAKFRRPERMKRHMENDHRVSVEWKLYCTHCSMGFPGTRSLHTHIVRQHPDQTTEHPERSLTQHISERSNTIPMPADIDSAVDNGSTAKNTEHVKQVALTTEEVASTVAAQAHPETFSNVGQLLSAQHVLPCSPPAVGSLRSEQSLRLEPQPSFEVSTSSHDATVVSCESVNAMQSLLTMYAPHSMQVGASVPNTGSAMQANNVHLQKPEQQARVPRGFSPTVLHPVPGTQSSGTTASAQHANPQVMVDKGMANEAPPGMLAVPLQQVSLHGVKTTTTPPGPARNVISSSQTAFASSYQHLQHQPYTQALIADFTTKPSPSQTGITTSQQPPLSLADQHLQHQPYTQALIADFTTKPSPSQTGITTSQQPPLSLADQHLQHQPYTQALIADFTTKPSPNQTGITTSQQPPLSLADQHLQHQPYTQALIADFSKPSPSQTGITTSQQPPLSLADQHLQHQPYTQALIADFTTKPSPSQKGITTSQQPLLSLADQHLQHQPYTQALIADFTTKPSPSQTAITTSQQQPLSLADQHLQHQPYAQALIADFTTKPSPSQTGITTSQQQPLSWAELPHSQANMEALNSLQHLAWISALDKPLVVQPQSTELNLSLQSQTYGVSASQSLSSFTIMPILNQPSQCLPVLAAVMQSLQSQPCIPVTHPLPQVFATAITSTQLLVPQSQPQSVPTQLGFVGLSELTPAIAPLHGSTELSQAPITSLDQPVSQQMSALIRPSHNQTVYPVLMSALNRPVSQVGNLLMPALIQPPQTQPVSQVHVPALDLQIQSQPVSQVGQSKFTESQLDQVKTPAWNQPSHSRSQVLSQPAIEQQLNTQRSSVVNPSAVPLQSIVKPIVQSCITPVCSPRCATSSVRIALPVHSSMPTALSFTSQPPLRTPLLPSAAASSYANVLGRPRFCHGYSTSHDKSVVSMISNRGETPTSLDGHQKVSDTLGTGSLTGPLDPTSAVPPIYTASPSPSSSLLPSAARLAYPVDRGNASAPMIATATYDSGTSQPRAAHNGTLLCESTAPHRLWPPYNVVTATTDGIAGPGRGPRMSPTRPPQIANELEDHMMRLSQVLSILPESLGLQQTLANDSASSQVVSATSTRTIHDDRFTANVSGLTTPVLGGQVCSTLHENATSLCDADTSNRDHMAPPHVTGSTGFQPASRPLGHVQTSISATATTECAAMPTPLVEHSLSIPNLLSGNPPIAPTQTGQKNVISHMVLPNVDQPSHEIPFQNVPSFEAYTTFQGHY